LIVSRKDAMKITADRIELRWKCLPFVDFA